MKNTYEVNILGQKFALKTEKDQMHVNRVVEYVNGIFTNIKNNTQNVSTQNIAILGALNIAEEMFLENDQVQTQVQQWKDQLVEIKETAK